MLVSRPPASTHSLSNRLLLRSPSSSSSSTTTTFTRDAVAYRHPCRDTWLRQTVHALCVHCACTPTPRARGLNLNKSTNCGPCRCLKTAICRVSSDIECAVTCACCQQTAQDRKDDVCALSMRLPRRVPTIIPHQPPLYQLYNHRPFAARRQLSQCSQRRPAADAL